MHGIPHIKKETKLHTGRNPFNIMNKKFPSLTFTKGMQAAQTIL